MVIASDNKYKNAIITDAFVSNLLYLSYNIIHM